ncbi:MAG: hypothetical protein NWE86_07270 [Candidatus Bathyarchaeota archaeon]|nr:hypothetical protein [Candidatus Bathyarchaeota archaeon]
MKAKKGKIICFKINEPFIDHCQKTMEECFLESLKKFRDTAPSFDFLGYDYIQIIPKKSYEQWDSANDGFQGYRHKETGWTVPVNCIQCGKTPRMWIKTNSSIRSQLVISNDSPIWNFIVVK